jgi:hypothetical protein
MKANIFVAVLSCLMLLTVTSMYGQTRGDVVWARTTAEDIVLDGVLSETAWAGAESIRVQFPSSSELLPGSGWRIERGGTPTDPIDVTYKFLVKDNNFYLAAVVKDSSVGGGLFNEFDGFLLNIRNHASPNLPSPPFEYFYGWVTEPWADPNTGLVGASPGFFGGAAGHRDSVNAATGLLNREIWDAVTSVDGVTNSDTTLDEGYVVEYKFNLTQRGYDVTDGDGDVIEFNVSIYDSDWNWPNDPAKFSGNRTWLQGPWGNASNFAILQVHARSDVAVGSGAVPDVAPDLIVPSAASDLIPTIDGVLDESVWSKAPGLDIRFDDSDLRATYPGIGPFRSGQFQPEIDMQRAPVLDPADATLKYFFAEDTLYLGVDVRDQAVWGNPSFDRWDGIRIFIKDREALVNLENVPLARILTARVDSTGALATDAYLSTLLADTVNGAKAALTLKAGTTANDFNDIDTGYQIELAIDLTHLGYPPGRGDGILFIGACLHDGDEFPNTADNYGTRVWWMHEHENNAGPAWAVMDVETVVSVAEGDEPTVPETFALIGNYPNPFNPTTTIRFSMPENGTVTLKVYNLLGQNIVTENLGLRSVGLNEAQFNAERLSSGVYFYRLQYVGVASRQTSSTLYGKMMLLK